MRSGTVAGLLCVEMVMTSWFGLQTASRRMSGLLKHMVGGFPNAWLHAPPCLLANSAPSASSTFARARSPLNEAPSPSGQSCWVHATPWSTEDVVLPDADLVIAERMVREARAGLLVYGHIHTP